MHDSQQQIAIETTIQPPEVQEIVEDLTTPQYEDQNINQAIQ